MGKTNKQQEDIVQELPIGELRWQCIDSWLDFTTTAEVEPVKRVVGQDDALEALRFGLEINAPGQNIYVRGLTGTGRATLVEQLLLDIKPACPPSSDRCYVHNFEKADSPALLTLPQGQGQKLANMMDVFCVFVDEQLAPQLESDNIRTKRWDLDEKAQQAVRELGKPFETELRANDLALVPVQLGQVLQPTIMPLVDGKPVALSKMQEMVDEKKISPEKLEEVHRKISDFARRFEEVSQKTSEIQFEHSQAINSLYEKETRRIVELRLTKIRAEFPGEDVTNFLKSVVDDLASYRLPLLGTEEEFTDLYKVNPILTRSADTPCPVIHETSPTLQNLLGNIDREVTALGAFRSDHMMVRAGSLLRADGGFLVLEVRDILNEPGSWKFLLRTLKTGRLEISPPELNYFWSGPTLKPESIPVKIKVILIGDPGLYQMLDRYDPEFPYLFKVISDFDSTISRDKQGVRFYAGILAKVAKDEGLMAFDRSGVAAMTEHGARVAGENKKLTMRFGRLADVAREANHLAVKQGRFTVGREQVYAAVQRGRHRADLPARRYRQLITTGTIRVDTDGARIGQINGLAVIQSGPLTYGFPSRITASIGPGTTGTMSIERESDLSGAIHTKGFFILGGLLRNLLKTEHPLAFSASVAFEQSYGGIDGDSASGAEMVCLLSALTNIPLRQDLAMTGAIDQLGNIQPIGAVSEKVEGFYEVCRDMGLTGNQGVVIPRANVGDLMLNPELMDICAAGKFHVYAIDTIQQALQLFTGWKIGIADSDSDYPKGTLLNLAKSKAFDFWKMTSQSKFTELTHNR